MDDILKECKNQTQAYTHLTVQMDILLCPNKHPIYFCSFQFPKLKQDSNYIKKTDRVSRHCFRRHTCFFLKKRTSYITKINLNILAAKLHIWEREKTHHEQQVTTINNKPLILSSQ